MPYNNLIIEFNQGLAEVTINRPQALNALNAATIEELHRKARFVQISAAGLRESHVHDVIITKEAPNYRTEGI